MALGEDALTDEEFAEIVSLKRSLVRWRGQWVRIDHDETDRIAELAGQSGTLELTEAVAAALAGQAEVDDDLGWIEATAEGDSATLVDRLRAAPEPDEARIVAIEGELRDVPAARRRLDAAHGRPRRRRHPRRRDGAGQDRSRRSRC